MTMAVLVRPRVLAFASVIVASACGTSGGAVPMDASVPDAAPDAAPEPNLCGFGPVETPPPMPVELIETQSVLSSRLGDFRQPGVYAFLVDGDERMVLTDG